LKITQIKRNIQVVPTTKQRRGQNMNSEDEAKLHVLINEINNISYILKCLFTELQRASKNLKSNGNYETIKLHKEIQSINTQIHRKTMQKRNLEEEMGQLFAKIYSSENSGISAPDQNNNSPNS